MKSLNTIQTLAKVAKVICKVLFILCIVGACLCFFGILSLALIPQGIKIGDTTIYGLIEESENLSLGKAYAGMTLGFFVCLAEIILCKFAEKYFENELKAGTPFTFEGSKEILKLGIICIVVPIAAVVVATIVEAILDIFLPMESDVDSSNYASVGIGLMFIVLSVIFKYGAELQEKKDEQNKPAELSEKIEEQNVSEEAGEMQKED